jgi:hypothetical protein
MHKHRLDIPIKLRPASVFPYIKDDNRICLSTVGKCIPTFTIFFVKSQKKEKKLKWFWNRVIFGTTNHEKILSITNYFTHFGNVC